MMAASPIAVLVNGRPSDLISVADRGLQFGDGLFETIAILNGNPCLLDAHLDRLQRGCERLGLPVAPRDLLRAEIAALAAGQPKAVIKLIFTAGISERGYRRPAPVEPSRLLIRSPAPDYPSHHWSPGVGVVFCRTRLGSQPDLAGVKHLNRLEQVLARRELDALGVPEGLMLNSRGEVIEGVMSNVFVVRNGCLLTPVLDEAGVAGVMRERIIQLARGLGWAVEEARLDRDAVRGSDELFLCNSLIGIWPVSSLEGKSFAGHRFAHALLRELSQTRAFLIPEGARFDS